jgi:hypothetical protein
MMTHLVAMQRQAPKILKRSQEVLRISVPEVGLIPTAAMPANSLEVT